MQYTVVHSKDPYLLARLATDLQMSGLIKRFINTNYWHPFENRHNFCWINDGTINSFNFGEHEGCIIDGNKPIRHELTSRNYIKVLTQILEP